MTERQKEKLVQRIMDNPDAYVVIIDGDVAVGEINLDGEEIR